MNPVRRVARYQTAVVVLLSALLAVGVVYRQQSRELAQARVQAERTNAVLIRAGHKLHELRVRAEQNERSVPDRFSKIVIQVYDAQAFAESQEMAARERARADVLEAAEKRLWSVDTLER